MTHTTESGPPRYRCCPHCADDIVHAVEPDDHEVPCNAPNSRGCVGKTRVTAPASSAPTPEDA